MDSLHDVYISVGSNIGDKLKNCRNAIHSLSRSERVELKRISDLYKTEPVDYTDQDWFVNAVFQIETRMAPEDLIGMLKNLERQAGRNETIVRFGPRILDLDILFYDDEVIQTPHLMIPHPRMHKRRFVLLPICDIDPFLIHPMLKQTMQSLLAQLPDEEQKVVRY